MSIYNANYFAFFLITVLLRYFAAIFMIKEFNDPPEFYLYKNIGYLRDAGNEKIVYYFLINSPIEQRFFIYNQLCLLIHQFQSILG